MVRIKSTPVSAAARDQEAHPMTAHEIPPIPADGRSQPVMFSDAIDAIGIGPFQTRLIMCGMVSLVYSCVVVGKSVVAGVR